MNWLLAFLLAYLLPGVDDLDVEPPVDDEPPADEPPADDEPPEDEPPADEDDPEPDDEPPAPRETRAQKTIRETRERAQNAERELATARAELEAARRPQQQGPATPDPEEAIWRQEEETLRNPEASDWQKYAINANRAARNAQRQSQQALAQAQDMGDRTAFQALAATKPKVYAAYKDRVEARVTELRAKGINAPRELVLKTMLGEDMLAGNLRSATKKPTTPAAPRRAAPASDVPARPGRPSDAEARAKRLENIRI